MATAEGRAGPTIVSAAFARNLASEVQALLLDAAALELLAGLYRRLGGSRTSRWPLSSLLPSAAKIEPR